MELNGTADLVQPILNPTSKGSSISMDGSEIDVNVG
jgi:hypothetical protein